MKDLNFIEDNQYRVDVNKNLQKDLILRMEKDKEFLKSCELMDYSLMIIFFKREQPVGSSVFQSN